MESPWFNEQAMLVYISLCRTFFLLFPRRGLVHCGAVMMSRNFLIANIANSTMLGTAASVSLQQCSSHSTSTDEKSGGAGFRVAGPYSLEQSPTLSTRNRLSDFKAGLKTDLWLPVAPGILAFILKNIYTLNYTCSIYYLACSCNL